jgi:alkyl hydroperoxide reductase subunit AhpC
LPRQLGQIAGRHFISPIAGFSSQRRRSQEIRRLLEDKGITDRATVIIDKQGVVQYAVSGTPAGERNPKELLAECQKVNKG